MRARLLPIFTAIGLAAGAIGGCGDGDDSGLAGLAPPDVPFYGEAVVRPDAEQTEAIESFATNLGEPDPGAALLAALDELFSANDLPVSYADDVEPWLGEHMGVFVLSFEPSGSLGELPDFALLAEVADEDAATDFVERLKESDSSQAEGRSYNDFDYSYSGGSAIGIIDDTFVVGSEAAFKLAVDAKDGESLAESDEYSERIDEIDDEPLATAFVEVGTAIDAAIASGDIPDDAADMIRPLLAGGPTGPLAVALTATTQAASLDLVTSVDNSDTLVGDAGLLEGLPGDSVLAIGAPALGETVTRALDQLETGGIPGASLIRDQLEAATGLDLDEDIASWLGDVSAFLRGTPADGGFGVVAETREPEGPRALLEAARSIIEREEPQAPIGAAPTGADYGFSVGAPGGTDRLEVGVSGSELVASLGIPAAEAADPDQTLADEDLFDRAAEALDSEFEPSLYAVLPGLLPFAQAGGADEGRDYTEAIPYAEALGYLIAGTRVDGDLVIARLSVGNEGS